MDWAGRYRGGDTPWDLGRPHPELVRRLAAGELGPPGRALVPGCGRGHDALALAGAGWEVTALDLVALEGPSLSFFAARGGRFLVRDALGFASDTPFDLVLDHTFFCAVEPSERPAWGRMVTRTLAPAGRLFALIFPVGRAPEEGGPPFGMHAGDLLAALGEGFTLECDEPTREPIAERRWGERWAVLRRDGRTGGEASRARAATPIARRPRRPPRPA